MNINISNYEIFALDYLEGSLESEEIIAMQTFLNQHPNIARELESLREMVILKPDETISFKGKAALLKDETPKIIWLKQGIASKMSYAAAISVLLISVYTLGYWTAKKETAIGHLPIRQTETISQEKVNIDESLVSVEDKDKSSIRIVIQGGNAKKANTISSKKYRATHELALVKAQDNRDNVLAPFSEDIPEITTAFLERQKSEKLLAPLPSRTIRLIPVERNFSDSSALPIALAQDTKRNSRFELDKVKQYLAKLPFEDLTVAHFIPSYFLDNQKGKNIF